LDEHHQQCALAFHTVVQIDQRIVLAIRIRKQQVDCGVQLTSESKIATG
jgi:hypothetical protein